MGGWSSAKMLLDVYGHYMPNETHGYADARASGNGPYTALTLSHSSEAMPQSDIKLSELQKKNGADERTRTADLLITKKQRRPG